MRKAAVYMAVRHSIPANWINDRDQFLYPNDGWNTDFNFQTDSLVFTVFSHSNNIKSADGINHWIPFPESEVGARDKYASHFLLEYMAGKWKPDYAKNPEHPDYLEEGNHSFGKPLSFTPEAQAVFDAARELWRYYHSKEDSNPNASFYDIREYFQGRKANGVMNPDSKDTTYTALLDRFKQAYKQLAANIEPKIYQYGFLQK